MLAKNYCLLCADCSIYNLICNSILKDMLCQLLLKNIHIIQKEEYNIFIYYYIGVLRNIKRNLKNICIYTALL